MGREPLFRTTPLLLDDCASFSYFGEPIVQEEDQYCFFLDELKALVVQLFFGNPIFQVICVFPMSIRDLAHLEIRNFSDAQWT